MERPGSQRRKKKKKKKKRGRRSGSSSGGAGGGQKVQKVSTPQRKIAVSLAEITARSTEKQRRRGGEACSGGDKTAVNDPGRPATAAATATAIATASTNITTDVYCAEFDFSGDATHHMMQNLHAGAHVRIVKRKPSGWWWAVKLNDGVDISGSDGYVPADFLRPVIVPQQQHELPPPQPSSSSSSSVSESDQTHGASYSSHNTPRAAKREILSSSTNQKRKVVGELLAPDENIKKKRDPDYAAKRQQRREARQLRRQRRRRQAKSQGPPINRRQPPPPPLASSQYQNDIAFISPPPSPTRGSKTSTTHSQQHQLDADNVPPTLNLSPSIVSHANQQRWKRNKDLGQEQGEGESLDNASLDNAEAAQQWWRKWLRERIDVNISVSLKQHEQEAREDASAASEQGSFWKLDAGGGDAESTSSGFSARSEATSDSMQRRRSRSFRKEKAAPRTTDIDTRGIRGEFTSNSATATNASTTDLNHRGRNRSRRRRRARKPTPAAVAALATMHNNPKQGLSSWASNVLWSSAENQHRQYSDQRFPEAGWISSSSRGKSMPAPSERSVDTAYSSRTNSSSSSFRTSATSLAPSSSYSTAPSAYSSMSANPWQTVRSRRSLSRKLRKRGGVGSGMDGHGDGSHRSRRSKSSRGMRSARSSSSNTKHTSWRRQNRFEPLIWKQRLPQPNVQKRYETVTSYAKKNARSATASRANRRSGERKMTESQAGVLWEE